MKGGVGGYRHPRRFFAARDEPLSGNKAWLRRQLHAAIVRAHLEGAAAEGV